MYIPDYVKELMSCLREAGHESYIVGGALRSTLLSLPVKDYDMTTDALPEEMKEIFREYRTIDTGIQHGTVTVLSHHIPIEITTYRTDSAYDDHRHPSSVTFSRSLQEDCARRDFTVNAICADMDGNITDFFGGRQDLADRVIRAIGDPEARFDEDALRILRALRFASVLSFAIEEETDAALRRQKELLAYVSAERIHAELDGILEGAGKADVIRHYREVFAVFLPLKDVSEAAWEKAADALERSGSDARVNMALLLAFCLKDQMKEVMESLKYSNADRNCILSLVSAGEMKAENRIDMKKILASLACPFDLYLDYRCALDAGVSKEKLSGLYEEAKDCCYTVKDLAVGGRDLQELGFKGREIHDALAYALHMVIEEKVQNSREAILHCISDHSRF